MKILETFVLMPFNEKFDDVYKLGIKETVEKNDINVSRLDEEIFDSNMVQKIYDKIQNADFIIADMSTRNPNVFYEVGYADALQKKMILLTNNQNDIPFDLLQRQHIIYKNLTDLINQLEERIKWIKKEIIEQKKNYYDIDFKVKWSELERENYYDKANISFDLVINNTSKKNIDVQMVDLFMSTNWIITSPDGAINEEIIEIDEKQYKRFRFSPNIKTIPSNDHISFTLNCEKRFYSIDLNSRKESYTLRGNIGLSLFINGEKINKQTSIEQECYYMPF